MTSRGTTHRDGPKRRLSRRHSSIWREHCARGTLPTRLRRRAKTPCLCASASSPLRDGCREFDSQGHRVSGGSRVPRGNTQDRALNGDAETDGGAVDSGTPCCVLGRPAPALLFPLDRCDRTWEPLLRHNRNRLVRVNTATIVACASHY